MSQVLAIDLGGSGMKLGLFSQSGSVVAQARVLLCFDERISGRSEADPQLWWEAVARGVAELGAGLGDVGMVALCGFTRTQVFLDRDLRVIRPSLGFRDNRAGDLAAELQSLAGAEAGLNGFHPLARLAWLQAHEPAHWDRLHAVIDPKDYLILRLTGQLASDSISLKLLVDGYAGGACALAARLGLSRDLLPPIGAPLDVVGVVRRGLGGPLDALAGAKVMLGANDTWMAVAGMGAMAAGRAYCISGSSEVVGLLSAQPARAQGLVQVQWGRDLWHLGGPGQNGSNVCDWAAEAFAPPPDTAQEQAQAQVQAQAQAIAQLQPQPLEPSLAQARLARNGLLFLPFLHGERVPYWNGDLRGAVLGVDNKTTAADLHIAARAGVAHINRVVLERAAAAAGEDVAALRIGGGGSRDRLWNQIRADVLGREILVSPTQEMGLAGLHAAARVALGEADDLATAAQQSLPPFESYHPDPQMRGYHDEMHAIFYQAHEALAPISSRLVQARSYGT